MHHSFEVEIAANHGVNVAIFLNHISFWIQKNMANNKHNHEGRFWTYNSQEAFKEIFPYWTRQKLRTTIDYCLKNNLIIKGNFNETKYDRTTWYALTDRGLNLFKFVKNTDKSNDFPIGENQPIEMCKTTNGMVANNRPIPYTNTDTKPYIKNNKAQSKKQIACDEIDLPDWLPKQTWEEFKQHRKEIKKPMSVLAQKKTIKQLEKMRDRGQDIESVINQSIANGWQGIFENNQFKGKVNGTTNVVHGKNGLECEQRNWNSIQWDILKEGCGLPRDANLSQIKGLIPGEVWDDLPDPRRDYDGRPTLDYDIERDC